MKNTYLKIITEETAWAALVAAYQSETIAYIFFISDNLTPNHTGSTVFHSVKRVYWETVILHHPYAEIKYGK